MIRRLLDLPMNVVRLLTQSMLSALAQIWANKVRSILTTLGIIIGIASVTGVIGSLSGLKSKVFSEFQSFGLKKIYVSAKWPDSGPLRNATWWDIQFKPRHFKGLFNHCPSIEKLTRINTYNVPASHNARSVESVNVSCVDIDWFDIESRDILFGRPFSAVDSSQGRRVCLINKLLRDKLHLDRDCVGAHLNLGGSTYNIIGVIDDPPAYATLQGANGKGDLYEVMIPFTTRYKEEETWFYVLASSRTPKSAPDAKAELSFFLRKSRGQNPGDPDTFRVLSVEKELEKFNNVMTSISAIAGGIVVISLLVGGIGIMNIMLVSVSERTREIGLRKAVGAKGSAILTQFLVESVMLCCIGGALGLGLGYLITFGIRQIPGAELVDQAYIPGWAIALAFIFSTAVGVFFGVFPAIKAARLNPIEALRNE